MTEKKTPEIRFKGFTGDWEQRKAGNVYSERKEKGSERLPILSVSIHSGVSDGELNPEILGKEVRRSENKSLYKRVFSGDLVFNMMRAWQGAIGVVKNEGMVSPAYVVAKPNSELYPRFMNYYFQNPPVIYKLNNLSYGVTDFRKRLYWDSFANSTVRFPTPNEQKLISNFLDKLSDTIALHQRKLELLQQTKKGFLQKIFPPQGESHPQLRFKEFSEPWEQLQFTSIAERVSKQSNADNIPKIEFEDIISGQGELNKDVSKKFDSRKGILFETNDVLFGKLRPYLKNWLFPDFPGIALGDFWVLRSKKGSPSFLYYLIQADNFQNVANRSSGTKMPRSDWKTVSTTEFKIPKNEAERMAIGEFFSKVDSLIALHKKKIKHLKKLKKAYMQKMFI